MGDDDLQNNEVSHSQRNPEMAEKKLNRFIKSNMQRNKSKLSESPFLKSVQNSESLWFKSVNRLGFALDHTPCP